MLFYEIIFYYYCYLLTQLTCNLLFTSVVICQEFTYGLRKKKNYKPNITTSLLLYY